MSIKLSNVKISCKIPEVSLDFVEERCKEKHWICKRYSNFLVVRNQFTFVLFKKSDSFCRSWNSNSQHCNITKIPSLAAIEDSLTALSELIYKRKRYIKSVTIDNLTASGDLKRQVNLRDFVLSHPDWHYNSEQFPGSFHTKNKINIILFASGKVSFFTLND